MTAITRVAIKEVQASSIDGLPPSMLEEAQPLVLRGYIREWPLVQEALKSDQHATTYLNTFYNQRPVHLMQAESCYNGRLFYNQDLTGFNFSRSQTNLESVLEQLIASKETSDAPTYYVGSTAVDTILPGFRTHNDIQALADEALISIWMGNQSRISAHYDAPDNIACVAAGKRRFTLFPPEQIDNLYIGPIDFTPAGQPASLVDFHAPDYQKYPRFKEAVNAAVMAELAPGDALYIPSMWWHHVEGLSAFNILVNYWWRQVDNYVGVPSDAMYHAILAIRELPKSQRESWKKFFDYYVFSHQEPTHIPADKRGSLAPLNETKARQLRSLLLNKLNR